MTGAETRSKTTDETMKKLESQLQNYMGANDSKMDDLGKKLDNFMEKLLSSPREGILGSAPLEIFSSMVRSIDLELQIKGILMWEGIKTIILTRDMRFLTLTVKILVLG